MKLSFLDEDHTAPDFYKSAPQTLPSWQQRVAANGSDDLSSNFDVASEEEGNGMETMDTNNH